MKAIIVVAILAVLAWQGYGEYKGRRTGALVAEDGQPEATPTETATTASFQCDGRTHCSQMSSCAEATFFLKNCPGVKMDGNNDGVPCEQQWCR